MYFKEKQEMICFFFFLSEFFKWMVDDNCIKTDYFRLSYLLFHFHYVWIKMAEYLFFLCMFNAEEDGWLVGGF